MARPYPSEAIPTAVLLFCERKGTTVSRLAEDMGHANNWIAGMFKAGCPYLQPYIKLADAAGVSLQYVVDAISAKKSAEFVELLLQRYKSAGVKHRADLSRHIGVSKSLISELCKDDGRLNGLKGYVELAEVVGVPVDELRTDSKLEAISA